MLKMKNNQKDFYVMFCERKYISSGDASTHFSKSKIKLRFEDIFVRAYSLFSFS